MARRPAPVPEPQRGDLVQCWRHQEILVERFHCLSPTIKCVPRHSHDEYQLALCNNDNAEYFYRGASHRVTPLALSVIHSGEVHETYELDVVSGPTVYQIIYVPPSILRAATAELAGRETGHPFFPDVMISDPGVVRRFRGYLGALRSGATALERDWRLLSTLTDLIGRFAQNRPTPRRRRAAAARIRRVRDFLRDDPSRNVTLAELAAVAGVSASHLCALFRDQYGLPPHRFQIQVRIERARALLLEGESPAAVAAATGFTHQSHLGKHFKRLVGVPPSRYGSAV
jgi:AraC-like DNA-binding protein